MPIKKDASGKRWVEMELLVPGTPEQVWRALATGPGYTAWFTKAQIEETVGGTVRFDFGEGTVSSGEVTAWEPPQLFCYVENEWEAGAPPVATEITITSRSGGSCVIRMVHSLFSATDDWDDQIEGFEAGWPSYFAVLRAYLEHFPSAEAASFLVMVPAKTDHLTAWRRLAESLGFAGADVGEERSASPLHEAWTGVVEHVHQDPVQRYALLRLSRPSAGLALIGTHQKGDTTTVSVHRYFYGEGAEALAAAGEAPWRSWLTNMFGEPLPGEG
jgi:uncharacterized protein YndB with AHSA1/START domain